MAARGSIRRRQVTAIIAGVAPIRTSLNANVAGSGATAMSQAAIRPIPPARALPFTRQTTGLGLSQISRRICGNNSGAVTLPDRPSFRSAPAQKTGSAPVSTITRQPGSSSADPSASRNWSSSALDSALRLAGEFSVTVVTAPAGS